MLILKMVVRNFKFPQIWKLILKHPASWKLYQVRQHQFFSSLSDRKAILTGTTPHICGQWICLNISYVDKTTCGLK